MLTELEVRPPLDETDEDEAPRPRHDHRGRRLRRCGSYLALAIALAWAAEKAFDHLDTIVKIANWFFHLLGVPAITYH